MMVSHATQPVNFDFGVPEGCRDYPVAKLLREGVGQGIYWNDALHGWVLTRYDDVKKVLIDLKSFTSEDSPPRAFMGHEAMLFQDGPLHNRMRAIWARSLQPQAVSAMRARLEAVAERLLADHVDRLKAGEVVDIAPVLRDMATIAITAALDVPDDRCRDFQHWTDVITEYAMAVLDDDDPRAIAVAKARKDVFDYLADHIADRHARLDRGEQPDDLVAMMVAAQRQGIVSEEVAKDSLFNLLIGGLDTSSRWMGNILVMLDRLPHARQQVVSDFALFPAAAEEVQRLEPVAQITIMRKVCAEQVTLGDTVMRRGDNVYPMLGFANRDPEAFAQPDKFELNRTGSKAALGFGFGIHQCIGLHLARLETQAFFRHFLVQVPHYAVVDVDYGNSWTLWGPRTLLIRL